MNVLFVSSGNSKNGINPIIQKQGESIAAMNISLNYFVVQGKGMRSYFAAIFELRNELKKSKYDIIHAHYALCGWVAFLAHSNQKLVISFMGDDLLGSNRSDGSVSKVSLLMAAFNKVFFKLFFDASIVKSPQMLDKFGSSKKNSLIANGVNSELFKPSDRTDAQKRVGFDHNLKHIVFVSDPLRVEKNYKLAKEACALINEYPVMLHAIYGKENSELPDYYNAADLLLMTSFHEGSPNVVKEAMSCDCPVVCTNVGDVDLLFNNTSGNFITNFEVEDVKNNICLAIKYRAENKYTNGHSRLLELHLDAPTVAKKIIDIYLKINKR
jgi:teichuronic acid biosynthesis glycosyltransferase TuaC